MNQIEDESVYLTRSQLNMALPMKMRSTVTDKILDNVNKIIDDEEYRDTYRDNFLSYSDVLTKGRWAIGDYISAVKFLSLKMRGSSNTLAYAKTFPDRYDRLVRKGRSDHDMRGHVGAYAATSLVKKLLEQSLVPHYILNQDMYQKALNTQAELMLTAKSEKVRSDAANSILTHLKMPDVAKVQLDMNVKEDDSISELRKTTLDLVAQQRKMLAAGAMNVEEIAESILIPEADFTVS